MPVVITDCGEIQAEVDGDVTASGEPPSNNKEIGTMATAADKRKVSEGNKSSHLDEEQPVDEVVMIYIIKCCMYNA